MLEQKVMSLFEYLGHAAGPVLGKEVARAAYIFKEPIGRKQISNRNYTGDVLLYRKEFLIGYFEGNKKLELQQLELDLENSIEVTDHGSGAGDIENQYKIHYTLVKRYE